MTDEASRQRSEKSAPTHVGGYALRRLPGLVLILVVLARQAIAGEFASSVVAYVPGGLPTSVASFTNANAVLGEPARVTPGQYGGPVDPFDPPYLNTQLVALGTNGSLTVQFDPPLALDPSHPYGLDFIIFGHAGFTITNGDYSGGGITDGTLFSDNAGTTRVSVSADNASYYPLDPQLAPNAGNLFPTDGAGDFGIPVNPQLTNADFAGKDLAAIRALYGGAGGGTGYSLSWALDPQGKPANLPLVRYVRIEVTSGNLELAGFAAVTPSVTVAEDFSQDPATNGWQIFGDTSLFYWNSTNLDLEVTWDSSRSNSYFFRPLGRVLSKADDFSLQFDLQLQDIAAGVRTNKPNAFELAVGFINRTQAFGNQFERGTGTNSPNVVEFDYFPDTGFGATISPVIVSSNGQFIPSFTFPLELTTNDRFHVALHYLGTNQKLTTALLKNGVDAGPIKPVVLPGAFTDFRVDTFAISSYSDAGGDGSLLAHGTIDNVILTLPSLPLTSLTGQFASGAWTVGFQGQTNWRYTLERSVDLRSWAAVTIGTAGASNVVQLVDTNAPAGSAFYRVGAQLP